MKRKHGKIIKIIDVIFIVLDIVILYGYSEAYKISNFDLCMTIIIVALLYISISDLIKEVAG
ncbi:MAG: hypothetical protein WC998_04870 [Candidatus Paceibacterota bacterium]|jgi:hypothetical protein